MNTDPLNKPETNPSQMIIPASPGYRALMVSIPDDLDDPFNVTEHVSVWGVPCFVVDTDGYGAACSLSGDGTIEPFTPYSFVLFPWETDVDAAIAERLPILKEAYYQQVNNIVR
jgi:hypothetical protein